MDQEQITAAVAADLELALPRVRSAVRLFDEGNTLPFIARYRKELTGSLDEEELRRLAERLGYRRNMEERRETIHNSLAAQSVLTPELEADVQSADTLQRLEDLYRPYRPKRQTRATIARKKGLQPLAELILAQPLEGMHDRLAAMTRACRPWRLHTEGHGISSPRLSPKTLRYAGACGLWPSGAAS